MSLIPEVPHAGVIILCRPANAGRQSHTAKAPQRRLPPEPET